MSATSATNAWAVGSYATGCAGSKGCARGGTLVEHWDGKAWTVQPSPSPGRFGGLSGVSATSPTNAWAVGSSRGGPLVERWDGRAWKVQPIIMKRPGRNPDLSGVASSPTNAWAVGARSRLGSGNNVGRTLIEHWSGTVWSNHKSPAPGYDSDLLGVAATSATNAWAVGGWGDTAFKTLIEHWNGTAWKIQKSPNLKDLRDGFPEELLLGVAATSSTNAWAVGRYDRYIRDRTLALHWNGTTWGP